MGGRAIWRGLVGAPIMAWVTAVFVVSVAAGAFAQQPGCIINPEACEPPPSQPSPPPDPEPTETPTPSPEPSPTPAPDDPPGPPDDPLPFPTPVPDDPGDAEPPGEETEEPEVEVEEGLLPSGLVEELDLPARGPRTRPRNSLELVALLDPLVEVGLPREQVLVEGMGRFPVAGEAYYSDDWLNPRFNPLFDLYPRRHKGLDIFASFGTPIRAPDRGVVTRISTSPRGGLGVWMRGSDGTDYYFAHLLNWAEGLEVGQSVSVGTVLGYVGDSGNARGGAPHLHFEIHRGGPMPPKPSVDRWLDEAIELAPAWVEARRQEVESSRELIQPDLPIGASRTADLEANMLLTLLDPVGGSVGLLSQLDLPSSRRGIISERLMDELIRLRLQGHLLVPGGNTFAVFE